MQLVRVNGSLDGFHMDYVPKRSQQSFSFLNYCGFSPAACFGLHYDEYGILSNSVTKQLSLDWVYDLFYRILSRIIKVLVVLHTGNCFI